MGGSGAAEHGRVLSRGRTGVPATSRWALPPGDVAPHLYSPDGNDAGGRGYHWRWRAGALSRAARGLSGGKLLLGAVPPLAAGRALRMAAGGGCAQLHDDTDGGLQAPVLRLPPLRRGAREGHGKLDRRREPGLVDGLAP